MYGSASVSTTSAAAAVAEEEETARAIDFSLMPGLGACGNAGDHRRAGGGRGDSLSLFFSAPGAITRSRRRNHAPLDANQIIRARQVERERESSARRGGRRRVMCMYLPPTERRPRTIVEGGWGVATEWKSCEKGRAVR